MRALASTLAIMFILGACAPAAGPAPAATNEPPAPVESAVARSPEPNPVAEFETSVYAAVWATEARGFQLELVDPATGEGVPGYEPIPIGMNYQYAFSPDGGTLAVISFASDSSPRNPILHIIDLKTWSDRPIELEVTGWTYPPAFSPDGTQLAAAFSYNESSLIVFDLESRAISAQASPDMDITRVEFTLDGSALMAYGTGPAERISNNEGAGGPPVVALYHADSLSTLWTNALEGVRDGIYAVDENASLDNLHEDPAAAIYLFPGVVFAPDRDSLYVVHADEDKLTTVDFTARSTKTVSLAPQLSWFEKFLMLGAQPAAAKIPNGTSRRAVISPDGTTLYAVGMRTHATLTSSGDWEFTETPLGLQVIDPADGVVLLKAHTRATELSIAPDGRLVFAQTWNDVGRPATQVFEVESRQFTSEIKDAFLRPIRRMDGSLILVSSAVHGDNRSHMSAYSVDGRLLGEWTVIVYADWLTSQ